MKRMSIMWFLVLTLVLQAFPAYASEDIQPEQDAGVIVIEGEHYSTVNQTPVAKGERDALRGSSTELSGNDFLFFKSAAGAPLPEAGYIAEFEVTAPVPGTYGLTIVASPIAAGHVSPYQIRINDGEYVDVNSSIATKIGELQSPTNLFHRYSLTPVTLEEGSNTISFRVTQGRSLDGRIYFFLDMLELTKLPWGLTSIRSNAQNNLFEEQDEVRLTIAFTDSASSGHSVSYRIEDYEGNTVVQDELTLQDNVPSYALSLPQLGRGHYTVYAEADGNGREVSEYFSIVMNSAERRSGITHPFAIDVAGGSLFPAADAPGYARAVRLTGVDYVRERMHWNSVSSAPGTYDFAKYDPYNDAYGDEGIRVLQLNHITPPWAKDTGKNLPRNLMNAYDLAKTSALHYGAQADWEFWNEPDIQYTADSETADQYAAFLKATTIAARDAGTGTQVALAGIAYPPGGYVELLMQNNITDYIDIYNYHGHRNDNETTKLMETPPTFAANMEFLHDYGVDGKPIYVTEAGIMLKFQDSTQTLTQEQLRTQARYLATSTIESVAMGVDKHFWFVFPYYLENGMSWGSFSSRVTPYAAVNAQAAMTHALGEAVYLGQLGSLPAGVASYVFRDGEDSVAAIWSENDTPLTLPAIAGDALLTDIMGRESVLAATGGSYALTAGADVQYVRVAGTFPGLTEPAHAEPAPFAPPLSAADRVVLVQKYPEATAAKAKAKGYLLDKTETTLVQVDVYNFNDEPMTGDITGTTYGGWSFASPTENVDIAPYGKETVTFELTGSAAVAADVKFPVVFQGTFGGEETSKSVTQIASNEDLPVTPSLLVPNYDDPERWETNISSGSTSEATSPGQGEVQFDFAFGNGDKWSYPNFTLDSATNFAGTEGVTFEIYFPEAVEGVTIRSFMYESNGAGYLNSGGAAPTGGWQSVKMPWSDFGAFGLPDDNFHLDPDQIRRFSIGINSRTAMQVGYKIRNVGVYTQQDSGLYSRIDNLSPAHNGTIVAGNVAITAEVAQGEIPVELDTLQVLVNGTQVPHTLNGLGIQAAAALQPGTHALTVKGFDANGRLVAAKAGVTVIAGNHGNNGGTGGSGETEGGGEPSSVMKATAADLKPVDQGDGWKLRFAANAAFAELRAELFDTLSGKELQIEAEGLRLSIPAATLEGFMHGGDGSVNTRLVIGIEALEEYTDRQTLELAKARELRGGRLTAAGKPVELTMYAVDSGGNKIAPAAFVEPVTVTFSFGDQAEPELLGIYYWDEETDIPRYVRSYLNRAQGTIEARLDHFSAYSLLAYEKSYADVPPQHWLYPALRGLSAAHAATGVSDDRFAPDRQVTRAEFIALWMRALGWEKPEEESSADGSTGFDDVPAAAYYAAAVAAAKQAGIVNGRGDSRFAPNELITREEMAAMLVRGLEQAGLDQEAVGGDVSFADRDAISAWARPAMETATSLGLIGGYGDGTVRPQRWAARGEAAQMIWRAYQLQ
ncbi:S-layer homology domain-containing protein [Paenibacillus sp. PAMC21692]|uniref:S-layer homology domain-containing protein n=1 Tax=Paenibacillus sp. PAMC21692 TaxID=2762320 RepID=UPI00164D8C14|nr:S-layer homology domain-containing protein [Paenibacillus sp. PAMC21692]QNK59408.1 S-layer homology domain-containing protein [Paenibacillus sp. PAMC21692]